MSYTETILPEFDREMANTPKVLEPRRKKRRTKSYPLLNQPRAKAQKAQINGT